jgi:hypothetical protein
MDDRAEDEAYGPYQPYRPYATDGRPSGPSGVGYRGTLGRLPAASAELAVPHHHHLGISIFHDGNLGHLWRGEFFSRLGEAVLGVGVVMWLAGLYRSPLVIAAALLALGLPFVLAGPLAARLQNARHPDAGLKWLGRLRILLALSFVALHYRTVLLLVFAALFVVSLSGRLRDALRVSALRACLMPGEPEHVANDLHIGAAVAAVLGPLLATLLYVLLGERILAVSIGAVAFFALSANSETFLDALPERRRAFLLARPAASRSEDEEAWDDEAPDAAAAETDPASAEERREEMLPPWYQQGPRHAGEALADIRTGLGLAGTGGGSTAALWALGALALLGGGLAALEVFYVYYWLKLPEFYLGPLIAAEGAGLALGATLGVGFGPRLWRGGLFGGMAVAGGALLALTWFPRLPTALVCAGILGTGNAIALASGRQALTTGFSGLEQRALAAAETWVTALCGAVGSLALVLFYDQAFLLPGDKTVKLPFATYPIGQLLALMGAGLVVGAVAFAALSILLGKQRAPRFVADVSPTRARLAALQSGAQGDTGAAAAWDQSADGDDGWGDEGEESDAGDRYAASASYDYGSYDDTGYQTGYGPRPGYARTDRDDYDEPRGGRSSARNRPPRR